MSSASDSRSAPSGCRSWPGPSSSTCSPGTRAPGRTRPPAMPPAWRQRVTRRWGRSAPGPARPSPRSAAGGHARVAWESPPRPRAPRPSPRSWSRTASAGSGTTSAMSGPRRWRRERARLRPPVAAPVAGANTTIGVVVTDAELTKEQVNRVAAVAHDGIARAVRPAHTRYDGDTIFCLATGAVTPLGRPGRRRFPPWPTWSRRPPRRPWPGRSCRPCGRAAGASAEHDGVSPWL